MSDKHRGSAFDDAFTPEERVAILEGVAEKQAALLEAICQGAEHVIVIDHQWARVRGTLRDWLQERHGLHYMDWEKRLEDLD